MVRSGADGFAPAQLNGLYNRCELAFNVQNVLHFGRELNERSFDVGMAGLPQVSDMGWLGRSSLGPTATYYSERVGQDGDFEKLIRAMEQPPSPSARQLAHQHFVERHSFDARLRELSADLKIDLTLGSRRT